MLFHVRMDVRLLHDMPPQVADRLKASKGERAEAQQRSGKWRHLWRIADQYASVLDVGSPQELHDILSSLPTRTTAETIRRRKTRRTLTCQLI